jgi:hypothetical protein
MFTNQISRDGVRERRITFFGTDEDVLKSDRHSDMES